MTAFMDQNTGSALRPDSQQKLFGLLTECITETVYYYKTCNHVEFYANSKEEILLYSHLFKTIGRG